LACNDTRDDTKDTSRIFIFVKYAVFLTHTTIGT